LNLIKVYNGKAKRYNLKLKCRIYRSAFDSIFSIAQGLFDPFSFSFSFSVTVWKEIWNRVSFRLEFHPLTHSLWNVGNDEGSEFFTSTLIKKWNKGWILLHNHNKLINSEILFVSQPELTVLLKVKNKITFLFKKNYNLITGIELEIIQKRRWDLSRLVFVKLYKFHLNWLNFNKKYEINTDAKEKTTKRLKKPIIVSI